MTGADKVVCQAATLLLLFTLTTGPARAQFGGFGGASRGGIPGGFGGGASFAPGGYGMGAGGDFTGMLGGGGGSQLMNMIPQLMRMANFGGGHGHHRRHRRR